MIININIKANANSLTLSEIYELLQIYSKSKMRLLTQTFEFKGLKFRIETEVNSSINYVITELSS